MDNTTYSSDLNNYSIDRSLSIQKRNKRWWTPEEDKSLKELVETHGAKN